MRQEYEYAVALLTATPTETAVVNRLYGSWEQRTFESDAQVYLTASFPLRVRRTSGTGRHRSGITPS